MPHRIARTVVLLTVVCISTNCVVANDQQAGGNQANAKPIRLRGEIVDDESGQPLPAKVSVKSANGTWYFPKSASPQGSAVEYKRQVAPTSLEQHVTLSAHPFEVELPAGTYTVTVERGKEYVPISKEVVIDQQPVDIKLPIHRWINMAKLGWYSGDIHVHRPLSEMPNLVMAEDLNVVMPLSHWVTVADTGPITGNRVTSPAPRAEWVSVDATHGIYPLNTEYEIFTVGGKSHTLGAVLLLGQSTVVDQGLPPVRRIAEPAHRDGAFLDLEKHSWAWTPMIVPLMKPDLFELANNHCWPTDFAFHSWTFDMAPASMKLETNEKGFTEWGWIDFGFKSYYAYLNCGFRMMPSAGTASGVHPVPAGFGRVYAQVPGEFTYQKWRDALLAGRSFVTTGPLLQFTFNDQPAGQTLRADANGASVRVAGTVSSLSPIDRVEIVVNGNIAKTIKGGSRNGAKVSSYEEKIDETIAVKSTSWVAVRCFESRPGNRVRFAHSAPVFVEIPGTHQPLYKDEIEHFVERIEREIARHKGVLNPDALDEYQEALSVYKELQKRAIDRPTGGSR